MAWSKTELFARYASGSLVVSDEGLSTGRRFWVDSGTGVNDALHGGSPQAPVASLDYAVGLCTANSGDVIYVMEGHTENMAADSAVDLDIAGIKVVGLGYGAMRPTFNASGAAGDMKLAAASVWIENLLFTGGIDATTGIIEVSAADCVIKNCEYRDVTGQATDVLTVIAGGDRLVIDGWKHRGAAAAGTNSAIFLNDADDVEIKNFFIYGNFAVGAIDFRTVLSPRVNIHDGKIWTENAADIAIVDTITGSTGWIGPNLQIMLQDNAANLTAAVTGATFQMVDPVYICNLAGEKAALSTWTASAN